MRPLAFKSPIKGFEDLYNRFGDLAPEPVVGKQGFGPRRVWAPVVARGNGLQPVVGNVLRNHKTRRGHGSGMLWFGHVDVPKHVMVWAQTCYGLGTAAQHDNHGLAQLHVVL
jgi:hypothetical protein